MKCEKTNADSAIHLESAPCSMHLIALTRGVVDPLNVSGRVCLEVGEYISSAHFIGAMKMKHTSSNFTIRYIRKSGEKKDILARNL